MPKVVTFKHQFEASVTYAGAAANSILILYTGVGPGDNMLANTVAAGHQVYSVDVVVDFIAAAAADTTDSSWMLLYLRAGQTVSDIAATDASNWTNIGLSNLRNQVIKSFTTIGGSDAAGPTKGHVHIKIPKIYQRVREGDQLMTVFNASAGGPLKQAFRYKDYS